MLRQPAERAALLRHLDGVDQLVLLGDVLELRHGPLRDALRAAAPVLEQVGEALPPAAEVVMVAGNHDHHLLSAWLERRSRDGDPAALGLESAVNWETDEPLGQIARRLGAKRVRAAYPGVWLRGDVYATHGHYGDRHTTIPQLERLGAAAMVRLTGERGADPRTAEDYEATLAPMYEWTYALAQHDGARNPAGSQVRAWSSLSGSERQRSLRSRAMRAAFPAGVAALNRAGFGPLRADISGPELRRAGLAGFGEVLRRLGVPASHVIFGHTHRAGPLERDDRGEWRAPTGAALINTGSWVHEPRFLGSDPRRSPYRPGFAAIIEDDGPPGLVNLLDGPAQARA